MFTLCLNYNIQYIIISYNHRRVPNMPWHTLWPEFFFITSIHYGPCLNFKIQIVKIRENKLGSSKNGNMLMLMYEHYEHYEQHY